MNNFSEIIRKYHPFLYKICRAYTDNKADFEDLYQEVLIQLWKSMPNFRGQSKLSTWVYKIALNNALVFRRKEQRRQSKLKGLIGEIPWYESSNLSARDLEAADLEREQGLKLLLESIRQLPAVDRSLMILYLEGMSYAEIAEVLGISSNHVGVKIKRTKNRLHKVLKSKGL